MTEMKAVGKRTLEWDLNDWKWDGDLFQATPLNAGAYGFVPELQLAVSADATNSLLPCSKVTTNPINENGNGELLKKKRIIVVHEDEDLNDQAAPLDLKLGEQVYPIVEADVDNGKGKSGKISKNGGTSNPVCQVEGCTTDLRNSRDYNRRHKVCEVHSKASEAVVGNFVQRFCQQCSRFHALEEFDGDKRSCRKRLAGHNKRRRKINPEIPDTGLVTDGVNAGQILNLLVRVLSNMHANNSNQAKDQDLLSQVLQNLAAVPDGSNTSRLLQGSQGLPNAGTFHGIPEKDHSRNQEPSQTTLYAQTGTLTRENRSEMPETTCRPQPVVLQATGGTLPAKESVQEASVEKHGLGGIDLNTVYNDDSHDCIDDVANATGSVSGTYWAEQTLPSPPPTSGTSATTSGQSSSSSGEIQCRTDRIVFKLFDKEPNDLPNVLRTQILEWLSHSPTDIEGYIRPGCIVLTLYLRLNTSLWEEFGCDISSNLSRLLDVSDDPFWKTGSIYARIQQRAAFICDGQFILDAPLPLRSPRSRISSISPVALPAGEEVQLVVRGSNLSGPTSRLLCAIEGRYLVQEDCSRLVERTDTPTREDENHSLSFSCSIPNVPGRGFIEVEDFDLSGCFFPFIVAEPDVCYEICMLEREMEMGSSEDGDTNVECPALDFLHEMGWLLHRNSVRFKENHQELTLILFPFERLKWLVEFSMDHDWRAVLKKLMDLLFSGIVDIGAYASIDDGLADIALLHTAVRRNSKLMVEFLLRYVPPNKVENTLVMEQKQPDCVPPSSMLFRPDLAGAGGLTPLHIAASTAGSENVLEALLEDPGKVGIEAWKNARDSTGLTPCDYASLRGHYRYLHLVQRKINQKSSGKHVVVDIPSLSRFELNQAQKDKLKSIAFDSFYTEKARISESCKLCDQMPNYRLGSAPQKFRPVMISLVAIAVVCVCTALLFKSAPQVCDIFGPFSWESLKYGAM
ncbi:squamosa promoter-binding-like protein 1 [Silene latifolia]|uniref:squamosa promoter-binding-like protein 1 n=1 Tax=Silene latifolia TaxID=37657 RepID=UPI003D7784BE